MLALSLVTLPAQAAPLGGASNLATGAGSGATGAEKIAFRRCWWHLGHRHCRWHRGRRVYGYAPLYHELDPDAYYPGTRRWWFEMDREGRGGRR
jgi:hypothetical protein